MSTDRDALRVVLRGRYPWIDEADLGPRSVVAGECDRCGAEARLVAPCGPPPDGVAAGPEWGLGRRCAAELGTAAWCGGHDDEAQVALGWLAGLPPEADDVARLWWVATGEVRVDPALITAAARQLALPGWSGGADLLSG